MIVVVSCVVTLYTFLASDQFYVGSVVQLPYNCIPVRIIASVAFRWLIAAVVLARIRTGLLLLSFIPKSVAVMVVWLG